MWVQCDKPWAQEGALYTIDLLGGRFGKVLVRASEETGFFVESD